MKKSSRRKTHVSRETIRHLTDLTVVGGVMPWEKATIITSPAQTAPNEACSGPCCTRVGQTY
jgi:hypothetical protein